MLFSLRVRGGEAVSRKGGPNCPVRVPLVTSEFDREPKTFSEWVYGNGKTHFSPKSGPASYLRQNPWISSKSTPAESDDFINSDKSMNSLNSYGYGVSYFKVFTKSDKSDSPKVTFAGVVTATHQL